VAFNHGAFGGAPKRFTNLFSYLNKRYPNIFCYIVNSHLLNQIKGVFSEQDLSGIKTVDLSDAKHLASKNIELKNTRYYSDNIPDPLEVDKNFSYPRKIYWYYKNMLRQKKLFKKIESIRKNLNIEVFIGVFSGVLPLTFYFSDSPRKARVIFSNMDSWFVDVHRDMKKLWYRKYYSFNDAMENSDAVDFLSPYILEGIRERGVKIDADRAFISPCSFADYSKCFVGTKDKVEIAFASRLEPDKNPIIFLKAVAEINKEFPEVRFHLLGEGSLAFEIEKYINDHNLNSVVNFRFHRNPLDVFKNTSIFVSLQSGTNYPSQSILEAMACGNAIIASNKGDTNLFINETNGLLIDLKVNELVAAIRSLIINKDKTRMLGANARNFALKNHNIEKFVDYYIELIRKVASKSN
jgi:glycosyltransferase involved in cell wall biosynthesis